ncbi:ZapG family protein [Kangiella geojedonensis]|uniref:Z-ring associated protein G n=1 Tax=Kangiella geojedonensis TaxID=914150 RepID=A0A0F6RCS5_9GAMM|nr:DUF1043 family protein [Kangiella geojedonensis]AKE52673.1 hypothetical protein TQ33_1732 [Kangiella geojedonensis]
MSPVLSIILILIAAVAAFFIGRWHGLSTGTKELTKELESKDKELDELKSGVDEHFDETARLFSNLTEEYKAFYQHLASGANKLTKQEFKVKLSAPVGQEALPSEASAAEVIDAEEHLSKEFTSDTSDEKHHEEESFIREYKAMSDDAIEAENGANESDGLTESASSPDLDIEVSPPKDWADGDMDDDYHPNDPQVKESEFSDLAKEEAKKPSAPGFERDESVNDKIDKSAESPQNESATKV